jgi:hydroxypyruvate isomerase
MPKLAANLSFLFQDLDFLDRFDAASRAGFEAVEYLFPYEFPAPVIAERLARNGLTQALFNLPPGDWQAGDRGLAGLPGREAEFREAVGLAAEYAGALGCGQVHAMAGLFAAATFAEQNVRLLIEPLNAFDMPGYLISGSAETRAIIEAVGSDNLFLQYDVYHMQIMEGNLAETMAQHRDLIRHVQIAGVPGRREPDVGEINYPFVLSRLDALGYDGWVGCEYRPAGGTLEGLGWAAPYGITAGAG